MGGRPRPREQVEIQRGQPTGAAGGLRPRCTGVPVMAAETEHARARPPAGRRAPATSSSVASLHKPPPMSRASPPPRRGFHHLHRRHRGSLGVWSAPLHRGLAPRLEPGQEKSCPRRRRPLDLEPGPPTLPGRHSNRRSLPCAAAPWGTVRETVPLPGARPETLDSEAVGQARSRQNRGAGESPAPVSSTA